MLGTLFFLYTLQVGALPQCAHMLYQKPAEFVGLSGSYYTDIEGAVSFCGFYIGGGVKTYIWRHGTFIFWPHSSEYRFMAGFAWNILEFGWRHCCCHPTMPFLPAWEPQQIFEGSFDALFVRVSNRTGRR